MNKSKFMTVLLAGMAVLLVGKLEVRAQRIEEPQVSGAAVLDGGQPMQFVQIKTNILSATREFKGLEQRGYEIEVVGCQFNRLNPSVFNLRLRKLPPGERVSTFTEALQGSGYITRINWLEQEGYEVATVCYADFPYWLGDHAVIQFREKYRYH